MAETTTDQKDEEAARQWFVLRVQSNREEKVRDNLVRMLELRKLRERVPEVLVPTEAVTELRGGKREVVQRKLFPGYVIVRVEVDDHGHIPDQLWQT
ncbi:MAG: transcription termination/antitermination NusG family protein, partial [Candidatus Brocadiaceae bacterium]